MPGKKNVWLVAGGMAVAAWIFAGPSIAAEITVTDVLPSDAPSLLPDDLLGEAKTTPPLPAPLPETLPDPDPDPAGTGSGAPPGATRPGQSGGPGAGSGGGSDSASDPGSSDTNSGAGSPEGTPSRGRAGSTIERPAGFTRSAGTLAANVADLAGPLSVPLGLMAAAAAALIIATRRPTALRKVDEEGTWGNDGRSHRL